MPTTPSSPKDHHLSPYVEMSRAAWSKLADATALPLTDEEITALRGMGDRMDLDEVQQIYLPLSRLLSLYVASAQQLNWATNEFLGELRSPTPYVIGVAGSVAVGKSTTARLLQALLARWPNTPHVELVTTDGFLYPNAVLRERNLLHRKGFPESYDRRRLLRFVADVKSGVPEVRAPKYSHVAYDIVPDQDIVVRQPDVLIVEGLNVLQPARTHRNGRRGLAVSDFFDFSLYVDANKRHIRQWYVDRFLALRKTAFTLPDSYFARYASLSDDSAQELATDIWKSINELNLVENVLPTRGRAKLVLTKGADHSVQRIRLRKL